MFKKFILMLSLVIFMFSFSFGIEKEAEKAREAAIKASVLAKQGKIKEAIVIYNNSAKIFKKYREKEPNNPYYLQNYQHCIEMPGYIQLMKAIEYQKKGDSKQAAKYFKAAKDVYGKILKEFPKRQNFINNYKYAKHYWYVERFKVIEEEHLKVSDFIALGFSKKIIRLSDYKGSPILLEFWASWCPESRKSLPMLEKLYNRYKGKGLVIITLTMDKIAGWYRAGYGDKAMELSKKYGYIFGLATSEISDNYGYIDSVPMVFLVDKKGKLFKKVREKERTEENLSKLIKKIL